MSPISKKVEVIDHSATGAAMREIRTKADIALTEIARRMGISAPYLSDLERGNRGWTAELCEGFQKAVNQK